MKTAALYARVSTNDKDQNPMMQINPLREHALKEGWQIVGEYIDEVSADSERDQYNRLMTDAHDGKFQIIAAWAQDRMSRDTLGSLLLLKDLKDIGVDLVFLRDPVDLNSDSGELLFTMKAAFAKYEKKKLIERIKAGMKNAARPVEEGGKGRKYGRPRPLHSKELNAKEIADLYRQGWTVRHLSKHYRAGHVTIEMLIDDGLAILGRKKNGAAQSVTGEGLFA